MKRYITENMCIIVVTLGGYLVVWYRFLQPTSHRIDGTFGPPLVPEVWRKPTPEPVPQSRSVDQFYLQDFVCY